MKRFTPLLFGLLSLLVSPLLAQTPTLTVTAPPTNEGLIGLPVTFTLSSPATGNESFVFDTIAGTANESDFIPFNNGVIEFAAGTTSETIYLTLRDDLIPEADETFQLTLSNPTNLTLPASPTTLTIVNDDDGLALTSIFSDGMVLQREKGAKLWGFASPGTAVTVQFDNRTWQTTSDANSRFEVTLDNLAASAIGRDLVITGGGVTRTISNVLVGEVWMGAGQSNMDFPIGALPSPENDNEVATANDPLLRLFLPQQQARAEAQKLLDGSWLTATSADIFDFAAIPYYFGKRLREELGVPVAIIETAWGGQPIQGFITEEKLLTFPEGVGVLGEKTSAYAAWEQALSDYWTAYSAWLDNPVGPEPRYPTGDPRFEANLGGQLYNGMVAPHVGYGMRGIIWGQGEANTFGFTSNDYRELFVALVEDWRTQWGEELPFYYAQLTNFVSTARPAWVTVQNEQRLALADLTKSGMAVTNDIGDPNDIHPVNKSDFAERLVRFALANEYGKSISPVSGPIYKNSYRQGNSVVVEFNYATRLTTRDGLPPASFEIQDELGNWLPATATIVGQTVVVSAASVPIPAAVRYAWAPNPTTANLINAANLPASVFAEAPNASPTEITVTASAPPTNEGLIGLPVTFTLSQPAQGGEFLLFNLEDGSALATEDYLDWENGYVGFEAGEISTTIWLTLVEDSEFEDDETFTLTLSDPSGLQLGQSLLNLTIVNDDPPPNPTNTVTVTANPTNEGLIGYPVTFTLSEPAIGYEYFLFNLNDGTALAGEDYLDWDNGYVDFAPGETTATKWITMLDDVALEPDENFTISLLEPFGLVLPTTPISLTILNDDDPVYSGTNSLSVSAPPLNEGFIGYPVTFTLSEPALGGERFTFSTQSGPGDSALAGIDYQPVNNYLVEFAPGESSQLVYLNLIDEPSVEPDETFSLVFADATGILLPASPATLTILNDDSVLDEFGASYGIPPLERAINSDFDNDGVEFFLEYAFNLDPTVAATPDYVPGQTLPNGEPYGLPTLITDTDPTTGELTITYTFIRRTNSEPKVSYIPEVCADGQNFTPATPSVVTPITANWEQVDLIIGGSTLPDTPSCFARVRVVASDVDGDGF